MAIPNLNKLLNQIVTTNDVQVVEWLFFGFKLVGIIIKMFTFNIYNTLTDEQIAANVQPIGPATGSIWGYSIILFATLGLIFISVNPKKENLAQIENVPLSLYAIVILLVWCIVLNFRFYTKINSTPEMPTNYNLWNSWSLGIIIILSVFCILEYLIRIVDKNLEFKSVLSQIRLFTILVFFSGIITIGIQDTILNNFLVDG